MISKKKMVQVTRKAESNVYSRVTEITSLVKLHAELGLFEFEVFASFRMAKKIITRLEAKGYYVKITQFKSLPDECRLHISWFSNF